MLKIFVFIDIWFVKQDIQKWLKTKVCSFLWRIWKWKEKKDKFSLTFWSRDLNPRFLVIFLPMIWIFMESEKYIIKSKQASKKDRTLLTYVWSLMCPVRKKTWTVSVSDLKKSQVLMPCSLIVSLHREWSVFKNCFDFFDTFASRTKYLLNKVYFWNVKSLTSKNYSYTGHGT